MSKEWELQERVKELTCLYSVSRITAGHEGPEGQMLQRVVDVIPGAFQYPEIACARFVCGAHAYQTAPFSVTEWKLSRPVVCQAKTIGSLEVYYTEERPQRYEGPFLKEEVELVTAICDQVGAATERKRSASALKESEERWRLAMGALAEGVVIFDMDGRIRAANPAAAEIIGVEVEHLLGQTPLDPRWGMVNEDGSPFSLDTHPVMVALRTGKASGGVTMGIPRPEGSVVWIRMNAYPMFRAEQETPCAVVSSFTDITEQKRSDEQIRFQAGLLNAVAEATIAVDSTNRITYWNHFAETLYGWTAAEALSQPISIIVPPESEDLAREVTALANAGKTWAGEITARRKDGQRFLAQMIKSPVRNEHGEIIGAIGVSTDITERKQTEKALAHIDKLEAIGVLAGGLAHDFNNILTAILGNITLAKLHVSDTMTQELLGEVEAASLRARDLTQQLLTFAKGGAPLRRVASIARLLKEVPPFVLSGSNIAAEYDVAEDLWPTQFDEGQMTQALQNLVQNAKEAMPAGGTVLIGARNVELHGEVKEVTPGRYVKITVRDQGMGIPPHLLGKIFDPFFSTKPGASGLGLATAHSVVKRHEGAITVESEPGRGTALHVFLPAAAEPPPAVAVAQAAPTGRRRVLLMDDEDMVRTVGARLLQRLGWETEAARNGEEALSLYSHALDSGQRFDAVILDLTVPGGMGGQDCLRELRKLDPAVKALVASGYANDAALSDFRQQGFVGAIPKPYRLEDLEAALREAVG